MRLPATARRLTRILAAATAGCLLTEWLFDGIEEQTRRVLENLSIVLAAEGLTLQHVVKTTVYLADMGDFPAVNEVMKRYFEGPYPARAAVGVAALPKGAQVEMDAIMVLADSGEDSFDENEYLDL